jgi:integrase/recombinase XerD
MRAVEPLLTLEEVRRIAQLCSRRAPTGIRNRALIIVLHCGALRVSEALALTPSSVNHVEGIMKVDGRAARIVHIEPEAADRIRRWLKVRVRLGLDCDSLFCTLRETPLNQAYVRQFLPKLASKAGINKPVHALALRDSYVASLLEKQVSPEELQAFLGFKSLASTIRYVNELALRQDHEYPNEGL